MTPGLKLGHVWGYFFRPDASTHFSPRSARKTVSSCSSFRALNHNVLRRTQFCTTHVSVFVTARCARYRSEGSGSLLPVASFIKCRDCTGTNGTTKWRAVSTQRFGQGLHRDERYHKVASGEYTGIWTGTTQGRTLPVLVER